MRAITVGAVTLGLAAVLVVAGTAPAQAAGVRPRGHVDTVRMRGGVAHVSGWARVAGSTTAMRVRLRIAGHTTRVTANRYRSDLAARYGAGSAAHGFVAAVTVPEGRHRLCVTATDLSTHATRSLRCVTVRAHYIAPSAPRGLRLAARTATTLTFTWSAPARRGGGVLRRYRIRTTYPNGHAKVLVVPASTRRVTVSSLRATHRYTVAVRATNVAHRGAAARISTLTTTPPIPAQRTAAPIARSRYLRHLTGDLTHDAKWSTAMGAADAAANVSRHRYLVLLDIGAQSSGGVILSASITRLTYAQLVSALESYVSGYISAQRYNAPVVIALGTSNDGIVSRAQGVLWAREVIAPVASWARHHATRLGRSVSVAGADDMEPGFSASVTQTQAWLAGYLSAGSARFVYNGSADGCPTAITAHTCNNGWTTAQLHWLAGGAAPTRIIALPQIYNTVMPWQWHVISRAGSAKLFFGGPLTERRACAQVGGACTSVSGTSAWNSLWSALRSDPLTGVGSLPYSTDLTIS